MEPDSVPCLQCGEVWIPPGAVRCSWCEDDRRDDPMSTHVPWLWTQVAQAALTALFHDAAAVAMAAP